WTSVPGLSLDALAVETANRLRPWQELDPRREYSLEQIDAGVQSTRDFLAARQGDAAAWLFPAGPHISPSSFGSTPTAAPAQQVAGAQTREKKKRKPRHRRRGRHK